MQPYEAHLDALFRRLRFEHEDDNLVLMAENILRAKRQLASPLRTEITPVLLAEYVRELWISESPPPANVDAVVVVDALVDGDAIDHCDLDDHTQRKLRNIHRAVRLVVQPDAEADADVLTVQFVKDIHTVLAAGEVIPCGGQYRTQAVGARGSSVRYCVPSLIDERLRTLLNFARRTREAGAASNVDRLLHTLRVGTLLFSEFLLIHPFRNGNGRTARILLSAFLHAEVGLPFSLYVRGRDEYVAALEARNDLSPPSTLASLVLRACNRTAALIHWLAV